MTDLISFVRARLDELAETRKWHHATIRIGRWLVAEAKR